MRSATHLAAAAAFLLATSFVRRGVACSCNRWSQLLSASSSQSQAYEWPLAFSTYSVNSTPRLRDRSGAIHGLEVALRLPNTGGCGGGFQFLVPSPALTPGARYTLVPEFGEHETWIAEHTVRFRAAEGPTVASPVRFDLDASVVSHESYVSSTGICGPPELVGRLITRTTTVSIASTPALLLFLTATLVDPIAGPLVVTIVTEAGPTSATASVSIPTPDEASDCVDVVVLDAAGSERWRRELCPTIETPARVSAEALALSTPAPERPSSATPTATAATPEAASCALAVRRIRPSSVAVLVALAFMLVARRGKHVGRESETSGASGG
jgi:hypothetical protein